MPWKQISEQDIPERTKLVPAQSEGELDRQARIETEAGVGIPIEDVEKWVESWDTPNELPMPKGRQIR